MNAVDITVLHARVGPSLEMLTNIARLYVLGWYIMAVVHLMLWLLVNFAQGDHHLVLVCHNTTGNYGNTSVLGFATVEEALPIQS